MSLSIAARPHPHLTEAELRALQGGIPLRAGRLVDHLGGCRGCLDRFEQADPLRELALRGRPRLFVVGPLEAARSRTTVAGVTATRAPRYRLGWAAAGRIGAVAATVAILALGTGSLREAPGRPAPAGAAARLERLNGALLTSARAHDADLTGILGRLRDAAASVGDARPDAGVVRQLRAARALVVQLPGAQGLDALGAIDGALQREGSDPASAPASADGPVILPAPDTSPGDVSPGDPAPATGAAAEPPLDPTSQPLPTDPRPDPGPPLAGTAPAPEDPAPGEPPPTPEPPVPAPAPELP